MSINLSGKLDLTEKDYTAPEKVIEEYLSQISEATRGIVQGKIEPYDGPVQTYVRRGLANSLSVSLADSLVTGDTKVDIQKDLGASGEIQKKYECYLFTPVYDHYKYRVFFIRYGLSNYPVRLVLEQSVANSIPSSNSNYIFDCDNREDLETLLENIIMSKRLISVMQEIIRIYHAKKDEDSQSSDTEEKLGDDESKPIE